MLLDLFIFRFSSFCLLAQILFKFQARVLARVLLGLVYLGTHVNMRKSPLKLCQPLTLNLERDIFAVKNNADI